MDVDVPVMDKFTTKFPTYREVIGVLRSLLEDQRTNISTDNALYKVAKIIYNKYRHDTVYCICESAIKRRMEKDWDVFKKG